MSDFSTEFAGRLKEERTRLGLSQSAFGEIAGVGKLAQMNYEKGVRAPSVEYLHAIGQRGVDTVYLMKGVRQFERLVNPAILAECIVAIDEIFNGPTGDRAACISLLYVYCSPQKADRLSPHLAARAIVDGWGVGAGKSIPDLSSS